MHSFLDKLFRGVEILIGVFLATMIALTLLNVIMRFVFNSGFAWSEEVARLCFIYLVYLGTIGAFRDNRHLGVEMVIESVKPTVAKVLYVVIQGIVIWMMGWLALGSWHLALQNINDRWVATQFPRALVSGVGLVTGIAIILIALANLYRLFVQRTPVDELLRIRDVDAANPAETAGRGLN
ncbi:MAG: TRAP transporter small permease [Propionibacteriaceae bacterium]|nr:TRAP transporter small permease [Propionibacteriaceae bacterium]